MTFDDILEQIITLLKRQGRVTYRSLKLRFDLDDEYLDVLKDEIIEAHQLAVDEDGRVLVWTGETEGTPVSASQPDPTSEQPSTQEHRPTQAEPLLSSGSPTPDAVLVSLSGHIRRPFSLTPCVAVLPS